MQGRKSVLPYPYLIEAFHAAFHTIPDTERLAYARWSCADTGRMTSLAIPEAEGRCTEHWFSMTMRQMFLTKNWRSFIAAVWHEMLPRLHSGALCRQSTLQHNRDSVEWSRGNGVKRHDQFAECMPLFILTIPLPSIHRERITISI